MIKITRTDGETIDKFPNDRLLDNDVIRLTADVVQIAGLEYLVETIEYVDEDEDGSGSGSSSGNTNVSDLFNANRPVTRPGLPNVNVNANTIRDFIEKYFFPFKPATIALGGTSRVCETGTIVSLPLSVSMVENNETIFKFGHIFDVSAGIKIVDFEAPEDFNHTVNDITASKQYEARVTVGNNGSETVIKSSQKSITMVHPYFYGMTATELTGDNLYSSLTKLIQGKSNKSLKFNGEAKYMYFAFPSSYGDIKTIKDPNNLENVGSFDVFTMNVKSTGLANNWEEEYTVLRSGITEVDNGIFKFNY